MLAVQTLALFLLLMSALLSIGLSVGKLLPAAMLAPLVLVTVVATLYPMRPQSPMPAGDARAGWWTALPLLCAAWLVGWTYSGPNILPAHDPIAIPALAAHLAVGELPSAIYPRGSFAHAYPSGAPLLFSAIWAHVSPAQGLMLLKYITLLAVVLIPASWGWLMHRVFALPMRLPLWLTLCYLAFWGLERTIGFVLPLAGKTALTWALALCPLLLAFMLDCAHRSSRWRWLVAGLALFGLIMLNYSMAHLTAACLAGIWLASYERSRAHWMAALRLAVMLALAAAMVLLLMRDAVSDPRAGGFQFAPLLRLQHMVALFLERTTPVVIFHNTDFGLIQPVYRGAIQLGAWVLAWMAAPYVARGGYVRILRACLCSILIILLAGFGVIPSGITLDYARWIVWPLQALSFAIVGAVALSAAREWRGPLRALAGAAALALVGTAIAMVWLDAPALKQMVRSDAVPIKRLLQQARWLEQQAGQGPCRLVGDSHVTGDNLSAFHVDRLYSHVPLVSHCRFVNGSWVDKGIPEARAWDGLPSISHLHATLVRDTGLLLIGSPERMQPYMKRLSAEDHRLSWEVLRISGASSIWRAHLAH